MLCVGGGLCRLKLVIFVSNQLLPVRFQEESSLKANTTVTRPLSTLLGMDPVESSYLFCGCCCRYPVLFFIVSKHILDLIISTVLN